MIFHNQPSIGQNEIEAVNEVLMSKWLVKGQKTKTFERLICEFLSHSPAQTAKINGVATSSGTAALYIALKVLGIGNGDFVLLPSFTCTAILNAIFMAGAKPVIADINDTDFNINLDSIDKLSKISAVILPHTFGVPANIDEVKKLEIPIIEDCAQSFGSKIGNIYTGCFGDISIFSFYSSKFITTGQGGMIISLNDDFVKKAIDYIDFDMPETYYPRFNFQITDIQAAIGIEQLKRAPMFLEKRKCMAKEYSEIFNRKGIDYQKPTFSHAIPNNYRFVIKLNENNVKDLQSTFKKNNIMSIVPIEEYELLHNYLGLDPCSFAVSQKISKSTLSLPIYPNLLDEGHFEKIINIIKEL
jgi:perosamine synthetase